MEQKKNKIGVGDAVLPVLCAIYLIGALTVFAPCGPKEDGSWMTCHWAGRAVAGAAAVLTLIALVRLFVPDARIRTGLDLAVIPVALFSAILPGGLIGLCMMSGMRCRSVTRPAAAVMSALVIAAAAFNLFAQRKKR